MKVGIGGGFYRQMLLFLVLAAAALMLRPLQMALVRKAAVLRDAFIGRAEQMLGKDLSYGSAGPFLFSAVDIRDIKITGGTGSLPDITASRVRIGYSLFALLRGRPAEALRSVRVDGPVIELRTEKELNELFGGGGDGTLAETLKRLALSAPEGVTLRVSGGGVSLRAGKSAANMEAVSLSAAVSSGTLRFELESRADLGLAYPVLFPASFSASLTGVFDADSGALELDMRVGDLATPHFFAQSLELRARMADGILIVQNAEDALPFSLSATWDAAAAALDAKAVFAGMVPSTLFTFSGSLARWNSFLDGSLDGTLTAAYSKEADFVYGADVSGVLTAASPIGSGRFELAASGGTEAAVFDRLLFSSTRGDAVWSGSIAFKPLLPTGSLTLRDFCFTKSGARERSGLVNAAFDVLSYGNTLSFFAETLLVSTPDGGGDLELRSFDITLNRKKGGFDFMASAFRVRNAEDYGEAEFSMISADGIFEMGGMNGTDGKDGRNLEISVKSELFALGDLVKMAGCAAEVPALPVQARQSLDKIVITSEVFAASSFDGLLYNVPHMVAAWQGDNADIWASFSLAGTGNYMDLSRSQLVWNGSGFDIGARADFRDMNDIIVEADLRTRDSRYTVQATVLEKRELHISSSFGLNLNVSRSADGVFAGVLLADMPRFPAGRGFIAVNAEADFRYASPSSWACNIERLMISDPLASGRWASRTTGTQASGTQAAANSPAGGSRASGAQASNSQARPAAVRTYGVALPGTFELIGRADQDGADFHRIYLDDGRGALYGTARGAWAGFFNGTGSELTGQINLRTVDGAETADAELRYDAESFFLWAQVNGLQSGRFMWNADNLFVTGDMGFFRTAENWSAAFDLSSLTGTLRGQPLTLSGRASLDGSRIDMDEARVSYGELSAEFPFVNIDVREAVLSAEARLRGKAFKSDLTADISMEANFAAIDSWLGAKEAFDSFNGRMTFRNAKFNTFDGGESFDIAFSRDADVWSVQGGPEDMIRVRRNGGGDFTAVLSQPSPVMGSAVGVIKDGMIDAEVSGLYIDISALWRYVPTEKIGISGGFAVADLRISGPINDPAFFGTARASSLRISIPQFLPENIGPTPAFIFFDGNEVRCEPIAVRIGNGYGTVSGNFRISRWLPQDFSGDISVGADNPIPLNLGVAGFLVRGAVAGLLHLRLDGNTVQISGDVSSNSMEITMAPDDTRRTDEERRALSVQADIRLTAGRQVEFLWPNADIPILQAYAASGSSIEVTSDTLSGNFSINGDVSIRGGEVFYFQRSFYIKEGLLRFNESELQFDPRFSARAETRDRTNNDTFTISMIIDEQPLRTFTPRFESTPALSQAEIFTLLGDKLSGAPSDENAIQRAFISSTADMLAQFGVIRQFEKSVRNFLRIDMFSLRTQALQNMLLLNAFPESSSSGSETRLGNYFDNTTVFLGKYLGVGFFIQTMLSMRYDPLRTEMGGLWIEPDLSMEFKGPLFDITWELMPSNQENLWIDNNRITLSKKWTLP